MLCVVVSLYTVTVHVGLAVACFACPRMRLVSLVRRGLQWSINCGPKSDHVEPILHVISRAGKSARQMQQQKCMRMSPPCCCSCRVPSCLQPLLEAGYRAAGTF